MVNLKMDYCTLEKQFYDDLHQNPPTYSQLTISAIPIDKSIACTLYIQVIAPYKQI